MISSKSGSSSTTRIEAFFSSIFGLLGKGKRKRKASVILRFAELELSAVIFDNGLGQTQPQAGALANGLGGEEGLHDARAKFGRHTGPAIEHRENNGLCILRVPLGNSVRSWHARFSKEGFIARKACDGAEVLTPQTPFGMTVWFLLCRL